MYIHLFKLDVCKHIIERLKTEQGVLNKVKAIIYGPGWSPGKPRTGDVADIPKVTIVSTTPFVAMRNR